MFPSYLELGKKMVPTYFEPDKHCCSIWREKKLDPSYLELKNVVHN